MKKLLAIIVLGLLWSNTAAAIHFDLTECYIKKINDPKYKYFERKSFKEMENFTRFSKKEIVDNKEIYKPIFYRSFGIFKNTQVNKFIEISFLQSSYPTALNVVTKGKDGETLIHKTGYEILSRTENNIFYGHYNKSPRGYQEHYNKLVVSINERTIELKLTERETEKKISAFLQCKKKLIKHIKSKKKKKNTDNFDNIYLIFLSIIGLINLAGLIYLIRRKK